MDSTDKTSWDQRYAGSDLVWSADDALYAAKHDGRDRWRSASDLPASR